MADIWQKCKRKVQLANEIRPVYSRRGFVFGNPVGVDDGA
jgi:hypothetical protein